MKLASCLIATAAAAFSTLTYAGADLIATKMRVTTVGATRAAQIDLFNRGFSNAYGSSVRVNFPELGYEFGALKLYQYFGGTSTAAYTVLPNQLGYLPFNIPTGISIVPGQLIHARIESSVPGYINAIDTFFYACQKGSLGCE